MERKKIKPIFIFSLPRSGSTLLQRILAAHDKIDSVSEPWVLLPLIYPLRKYGVSAEYSHASVYTALQDFCSELPNGESDYLTVINHAMIELYEKVASPNAVFFLDKTPRYALICAEIIQAFPDAKFIFLWRNPLSVIASMIETWGGSWNIYRYKVDLFDGLRNMLATCEVNRGRCLEVRYERLTSNPHQEVSYIFNYLEDVQFDPLCVSDFSKVKFNGDYGDPTGVKQYIAVSEESQDKWKKQINTLYRKWWCSRYLKWIGEERLKNMGYNLSQLQSEINEVPLRWSILPLDLLRAFYGVLSCVFNYFGARNQLQRVKKGMWAKRFD